MMSPHEPVRMRFRGRMKRLPLMSFAAAFRRDVDSTARALDILIQGPPEHRPSAAVPPSDNRRAGPSPGSSEGGLGGGAQKQTQEQKGMSCEDKHDMGYGGAGERGTEGTAEEIARALGADTNLVAIEKLAREHPRHLLLEALRRTKAIAPERIRRSPAAVFTGIARKLAAEGWTAPHRSTHV